MSAATQQEKEFMHCDDEKVLYENVPFDLIAKLLQAACNDMQCRKVWAEQHPNDDCCWTIKVKDARRNLLEHA